VTSQTLPLVDATGVARELSGRPSGRVAEPPTADLLKGYFLHEMVADCLASPLLIIFMLWPQPLGPLPQRSGRCPSWKDNWAVPSSLADGEPCRCLWSAEGIVRSDRGFVRSDRVVVRCSGPTYPYSLFVAEP
jgi:hypothetical protein